MLQLEVFLFCGKRSLEMCWVCPGERRRLAHAHRKNTHRLLWSASSPVALGPWGAVDRDKGRREGSDFNYFFLFC